MNPAQLLENWLESLAAQTFTNVVLYALLAIFLFAIARALAGRWKEFVHYTPNLLVSLGIFGTFVGIVIGLIHFQIDNVDDSIGALLSGLKTAFITSLAGMFLAILFKSLDSAGLLRSRRDRAEQQAGATPEDILDSLRAQQTALERLATAIAGNEESTLITQIRLLRSDQQDANRARSEAFTAFSEQLWKEMAQFAEMLSRSATETVIDALRQVIVDFNRNLTEEFGENFKQLNAAVEKLVEWQENYRQQLAEMSAQYAHGVQAITQTEASVAHISEEARQIPVTMGELKTVLETTQHQLDELERHLAAFRDMRDRAVEAVPQIQAQMDKMVEEVSGAVRGAGEKIVNASETVNLAIVTGAKEFENSVNRTNQGLTTAADQLANNSDLIREQLEDSVKDINAHVRDMINTLSESNKQLDADIKGVQGQVADSIQTMQKRLEGALAEVFQAQTNTMNRAFAATDDALQKSVARTGEAVNRQLEGMDKALQQELERVIGALGSNLASITSKFTEDYSRLTREMDSVVRRNGDGR